jgi:prevent-host-death family protein
MTRVGMHEAKTNLSRLIDSARSGEDVIIEHAGHPVAKIVPYDEPPDESGAVP